jgi:putative transposase
MFKEHSKEIGNILRTLCEYENVEVVEVSIGKIMYICVWITPKESVSKIMGKSALIIFDKFSELRKVNVINKLIIQR